MLGCLLCGINFLSILSIRDIESVIYKPYSSCYILILSFLSATATILELEGSEFANSTCCVGLNCFELFRVLRLIRFRRLNASLLKSLFPKLAIIETHSSLSSEQFTKNSLSAFLIFTVV